MAMQDSTPTKEELNDWFIYINGDLYFKTKAKGRKQFTKAGSIYKNGYRVITYKSKRYLAHRLIYLLHYGYIPKYIDHANGYKADNRIENLRAATNSENAWNVGITKRNKSGYKGIYWRASKGYYEVTCSINNKHHYLGSYKDIDTARKTVESFRNLHQGQYAKHN